MQSADCSVGLTLAVRVVYFVVVQDAQVGNVVRIRRIAERKSIGGKVCRRLNASVVPCRQKRQAKKGRQKRQAGFSCTGQVCQSE